MNRLKQKLSSKLRKKNDKEVRKSSRISHDELKKNARLNEKEMKKLHPHKPPSPQKRGMLLTKTKQRASPKQMKKTSKRTSPKEGILESAPAHLHHEGFMWRRTLTKQGALQRKILSKSSLKKR